MLKKLINTLKKDEEFYYAWQSNIAMSFYDNCLRYKKTYNKKNLNRQDLHIIANKSAQDFLDLIIKYGSK